jgi:hypothetical protein
MDGARFQLDNIGHSGVAFGLSRWVRNVRNRKSFEPGSATPQPEGLKGVRATEALI